MRGANFTRHIVRSILASVAMTFSASLTYWETGTAFRPNDITWWVLVPSVFGTTIALLGSTLICSRMKLGWSPVHLTLVVIVIGCMLWHLLATYLGLFGAIVGFILYSVPALSINVPIRQRAD